MEGSSYGESPTIKPGRIDSGPTINSRMFEDTSSDSSYDDGSTSRQGSVSTVSSAEADKVWGFEDEPYPAPEHEESAFAIAMRKGPAIHLQPLFGADHIVHSNNRGSATQKSINLPSWPSDSALPSWLEESRMEPNGSASHPRGLKVPGVGSGAIIPQEILADYESNRIDSHASLPRISRTGGICKLPPKNGDWLAYKRRKVTTEPRLAMASRQERPCQRLLAAFRLPEVLVKGDDAYDNGRHYPYSTEALAKSFRLWNHDRSIQSHEYLSACYGISWRSWAHPPLS